MAAAQELTGQERMKLAESLHGLGLEPTPVQLELFSSYLSLLGHWNQAYNLVASAHMSDLLVRHVLDSLSIRPFVAGKFLLDVGTGAGFPGVPLAIMNPQLECTLLDSSGKKIRFLRHVKRSLKQTNIYPEQARIEAFETPVPYDNITSRAFASLADFAMGVRHLAGESTRLLAMKGKSPEDEIGALPAWVKVVSIEKISVPGLHAERHLVIMSALQ